jgi:putative transposase
LVHRPAEFARRPPAPSRSCRQAQRSAPSQPDRPFGDRLSDGSIKAFEADYGAKWPKAVAKITEHTDVLLAFYDYPAQHWIHLRTDV